MNGVLIIHPSKTVFRRPASPRTGKLILLIPGSLIIAVMLWLAHAWLYGCYKVLSDDPQVWQASIDRLVRQPFSTQQIPGNGSPIVFVGSSSIRLFKNLDDIFAGENIIQMGFGGAKINDVAHYKDDIILAYKPKLVVIYLGINDLLYSEYQSVNEPISRMQTLMKNLQRTRPQTDWVILAQRPIADTDIQKNIDTYNRALRDYAQTSERFHFVDSNHVLLNQDKMLNTDYVRWDGLHLNRSGYQVWGNAIYNEMRSLGLIENNEQGFFVAKHGNGIHH